MDDDNQHLLMTTNTCWWRWKPVWPALLYNQKCSINRAIIQSFWAFNGACKMSIQIHEAHSFLVRLKLASLRGSSSSADSVFNETDSRYVFDEQMLREDCHTPRCNSYGTRRPNEPDGEVWRRQICWIREEIWWCQEDLGCFSERDSYASWNTRGQKLPTKRKFVMLQWRRSIRVLNSKIVTGQNPASLFW